MLFRIVRLPSDEPVQYVGVYTLSWGKVLEPTVAFVEDEDSSKIKDDNARLIEACQDLVDWFYGIGLDDDHSLEDGGFPEPLVKAEEAIAKARGVHLSIFGQR